MESKRIEGLWDCSYCDQKAIPARYDRCQTCGSPRLAETIFYLPQDIEAATLSSEDAAKTSDAPDWLCDYCGGLNSANSATCSGCGSARDKASKDYGTLHSQTPKEVFLQTPGEVFSQNQQEILSKHADHHTDMEKDTETDSGLLGRLTRMFRKK